MCCYMARDAAMSVMTPAAVLCGMRDAQDAARCCHEARQGQEWRGAATRYGLGNMRCGGDTYLVRHGVVQAERMEIGHWATGSMEVGYHRLTALEYDKRRLLRGLTFAASTDRL